MSSPRPTWHLARQAFPRRQLCRRSAWEACCRPLASSCHGRCRSERHGLKAQTNGPLNPRSMSTLPRPDRSGIKDVLRISEEVADGIATNGPVVALESTIYTHGALGDDLGLEDIVRRHGGIPAVVGILDGVPTVGLTPEQVARMVNSGTARKVSRRDIAYLVGMGTTGRKIHGGTTIAGTMLLARLAGIRVFGTGGLGGVHRGGELSLDVSADLTELGRTRVAVVSSGCKGFLDIPRTLEFLETQGALVATFADGRPAGDVDFPAFWARESGTKSPAVVEGEAEAAAMILAQERLGIESGMLFANPIPERYAIPRADMEAAIDAAVREADELGFTGSSNTPYILTRIRQLTNERSVLANKELVRSNVARAAKVAVELSKMIASPSSLFQPVISPPTPPPASIAASKTPAADPVPCKADILVAGSVAIDLNCDYAGAYTKDSANQGSPQLHTSNPACINQSVGGVGHNVALAAHRVSQDVTVRLCSMVGDDLAGSTILSALQDAGLDTHYVRKLGSEYHTSNRTAQYVAVNDADKSLVLAMADMAIFTAHSFPDYWRSAVAATRPKWLVIDGNWSEQDVRAWIHAARANGCRVAFEPVSTAKSTRLFSPPPPRHQRQHHQHQHQKDRSPTSPLGVFPRAGIDVATPNHLELAAMHAAARANGYFERSDWFEIIDAFGMRGARERFERLTSREMTDAGIPVQTVQLLPYIPTIVTKLGSKGCLLTTLLPPGDPRLRDPEAHEFILARAVSDHPTVGGVYMRLFPAAEKVEEVVSVNGVGDTFLGVLVVGMAMGGNIERLIDVAQKGAVMTLKSPEAVSPELGRLEEELRRVIA